MKKILTAVTVAALVSIPTLQANLVSYDGFAYEVSGLLNTNTPPWSTLNSGPTNTISSGNLAVSGLQAPTGDRVSWLAGNNSESWFQTGITNNTGAVFYSFAFQLSSVPTTTAYSFGFTQNGTTYGSTIWLRADGVDGFNVGLSPRTATATAYASTKFDLNTTIFLVGSYEFVAGTGNDIAKLWVNPSSIDFGADTAPLETLALTNAGGTDLTGINGFLIRGVNGSPSGTMDELRIATTWGDATPVPEPSTYALLALSGLALAGYAARRRRR
jgi:hypothetical protein